MLGDWISPLLGLGSDIDNVVSGKSSIFVNNTQLETAVNVLKGSGIIVRKQERLSLQFDLFSFIFGSNVSSYDEVVIDGDKNDAVKLLRDNFIDAV